MIEKNSEAMKVVKFKIMLEETQKYLYNSDTCYSLPIAPSFFKKYDEQDVFLSALGELLFMNQQSLFDKDMYVSIKNLRSNTRNSISVYYQATSLWTNMVTECCLNSNEVSYNFVFWLLVMSAINDDIYNNELSEIIDIAYCLKFNEGMIRDWCKAVEYVLAGNHLSETCDLKLETEDGNKFFLHGGR